MNYLDLSFLIFLIANIILLIKPSIYLPIIFSFGFSFINLILYTLGTIANIHTTIFPIFPFFLLIMILETFFFTIKSLPKENNLFKCKSHRENLFWIIIWNNILALILLLYFSVTNNLAFLFPSLFLIYYLIKQTSNFLNTNILNLHRKYFPI